MSIRNLIDAIKSLSDSDLQDLSESEALQLELQECILKYSEGDIYEWMSKNKYQWIFWAYIHHLITQRVPISAKLLTTGEKAYLNPTIHQYLAGGLTFIQGKERMAGVFCGYKMAKFL